MDALPETRNARAFAERHKGRVWLNYYQEHRKGAYAWNERDLTVAVNRTEALDASHMEIMRGELVLPRESDIVREFAKHMANVAKKLEEDPETEARNILMSVLVPTTLDTAFRTNAKRDNTALALFFRIAFFDLSSALEAG